MKFSPVWPFEPGMSEFAEPNQVWNTRRDGQIKACSIADVERIVESVRFLSWFLEGRPGPTPRSSPLLFVRGRGWAHADNLTMFYSHDEVHKLIQTCTDTILRLLPTQD